MYMATLGRTKDPVLITLRSGKRVPIAPLNFCLSTDDISATTACIIAAVDRWMWFISYTEGNGCLQRVVHCRHLHLPAVQYARLCGSGAIARGVSL
jgi:hypothetical protein